MSEVEEILENDEELSMEDKKKAINLEDLVYVREYINRRQNYYETETDHKYSEFTDGINADNTAFKSELTADNAEFKTDIQNTILDTINAGVEEQIGEFRTSVDNIIDGTTVVGNAEHSTNADNAVKKADGTYAGFTEDSSGALKIGEVVISKKILIMNTGETGGIIKTDDGDNIVYDMPSEMTFDGTYSMELGDGTIINFKPSNDNTYGYNYTYHHSKIWYYTSLAVVSIVYKFDFSNKQILILQSSSKSFEVYNPDDSPLNNPELYRISKIWKIIE